MNHADLIIVTTIASHARTPIQENEMGAVSPNSPVRRVTEEVGRPIIRMDFSTFLTAFIMIPAQIVRTGRRIIYRLLSWNPWQSVFLRFVDHL